MPIVPRTFSATEVAREAACPETRVQWLTGLRLIPPDKDGRFTLGAVLAVKMASALLESVRWPSRSRARQPTDCSRSSGRTSTSRTSPGRDPGGRSPSSRRARAEGQAAAIYELLGLPKLEPGAPIHRWFTAGRLFIRMDPGSVKVQALGRDPRFSLTSAVPDDEGTGGGALLFGTAAVVEDPELLAKANEERSNPDRYVVLEFDVDEAMTTVYEGDDTARRRWPS